MKHVTKAGKLSKGLTFILRRPRGNGAEKMRNRKRRLTAIFGMIFLFLGMLLTIPAHADITPVGNWTTGLTHTVGAGTDRLLVFVTGFEDDAGDTDDVTAVSYGGVPMTQAAEGTIITSGNEARCEIWILKESGIQGATGNTFSVTYQVGPNALYEFHTAATYAGVDQTTPVYDTATNGGGSGTNPIEATVNVVDGGMSVAGATNGKSGAYSWGNGWIEGTDQTLGGTTTMSTAENASLANGTDTASANFNKSFNRQVITVASFKPSSGAPPCENTYGFRKKITIDPNQVSGTSEFVDFPVLVKITGTEFQEIEDDTRSDGYDIIFRAWDGTTQLPHEIEVYDEATDELVAWVKVPDVSPTAPTEIYIYYGNDCITAPTETPGAVWDSNFKGVWHLKEDPTDLAPQFMDSTTNDNHATAEFNTDLWASSDRVPGQIGPALYVDDQGDLDHRLNAGADPSLDVSTATTLEAWVKPDAIELLDRRVIEKSNAYTLSGMRVHDDGPELLLRVDGGWRDAHDPGTLTTGWNYLVGTYDSTTRIMRVYFNGVEVTSTTLGSLSEYTINVSTLDLLIGQTFDGVIDEVRVSDIARSADWINTSFVNQSSPSTFYSVTGEEVLDPDAPSVTITGPTSRSTYSTENGVIDLSGVSGGTWGVVQVDWSNSATGSNGSCTGTTNWSASISLLEGTNLITVTALDSKSNIATDTISVEYTPPPPPEPEPPEPEPNPNPDAPGDTEIFSGALDPNVLIIFDSSGSMSGIMPIDEFDPYYDYTTPLLSQGKNVLFASDFPSCDPQVHEVREDASDMPQLEYMNYTDSSNICSGSSVTVQSSEADGFFYFDRGTGDFITMGAYNPGNSDHIKVWLPYRYADGYNGETQYEYQYLNWIFYYTNQAERDALEAQHWTPEEQALISRNQTAKKVVKDLIEATPNVRYGVMRFLQDLGGKMVAGIPSTKTELFTAIDAIGQGGKTPLAETQEDAWDYFRGVENNGFTFTQDYFCRKNFVIVMTDGMPNQDADNLSAAMKKDFDGDHGGTEANGWTGDESDEYGGNCSDYLDDIAYYMRRNDAWPDATYPEMPGMQNVSTYTIAFAFTNDLLAETAENGGGQYHTVYDYDGLKKAFNNIVEEIINVSYSYSAPVVPVSQMERTTSGDKIYLALFKPKLDAFWSGNIKKFRIATADGAGYNLGDILDKNDNPAVDASGHIHDTAVSYWGNIQDGGDAEKGGAGELLLDPSFSRNIYTWLNPGATLLTDASNAFSKTNALLTAARLGAADDTEKNAVIDFVHGYDEYDEDGDNDTDEKRSWILGDFLHSRPAVVGYNENKVVIFAGANDGMLHAFWDGDPAVHPGGTELWAYIPPLLLSKLKYLPGSTHGYYVDGSPQVYIKDADNSGEIGDHTDDRAILVCGLRRGGRAYFALDVTDPENPKIPTGWSNYGMWESGTWQVTGMIGSEMTEDSVDEASAAYPYAEMGQSFATPVFGKINDGGTAKYVAFLGGGYDYANQDTSDPPPHEANETMGRGIYVVDIGTADPHWTYTWSTDPDVMWSIPSDITAIDTIDNGYIDRLYVGDMGGRLWRFDVGNSSTTNWTGKILFKSNSPTDGNRKIFYRPDVTLEHGFELVYFGTGDRAHPKDATVVNRIYAVKDTNPASPLDESDLEDVTDDCLQDPSCTEDKDALRSAIINGDGWYISLGSTGEKVLASALVFAGTVYVTTFTPLGSDDPCVYHEGAARLYALDYRTGESVLEYDTSTAGLTKSDRSMIIGSAIPSRVVVALINGQPEAYIGIRGGILNPQIQSANPVIRVYWRQIN